MDPPPAEDSSLNKDSLLWEGFLCHRSLFQNLTAAAIFLYNVTKCDNILRIYYEIV